MAKKSFASCNKCNVLKYKPLVCCTNNKEEISNLDIMFIIKDYTEDETGLISSNYKSLFSEDFLNLLDKRKLKYFITSSILCPMRLMDNYEEISNTCLSNINKFLKIVNPKHLFLIGKNFTIKDKLQYDSKYTILHEFDCIDETKISNIVYTDIDSNIFDVKVEDVQNILENDMDNKTEGEIFDIDLSLASDMPKEDIKENEVIKSHMYQMPKQFLSEDYVIEDVQYDHFKKYLLLMFRDKDNKKICYKYILPENNYYWYEGNTRNKWIVPTNELAFKIGPYKNRNLGENAFEADYKIADKFIADYYMQKEKEAEGLKKKSFFFDIEVYIGADRRFCDPEKSEKPIIAYSFKSKGSTTEMYLLKTDMMDKKYSDSEIIKKYPSVTIFNDEAMMLKSFIKKIHFYEPTYLSGWNTDSFDIIYIVNRMKKLGLNINTLSPQGFVNVEHTTVPDILGYVSLDLMWLYKSLVAEREPSYSLNHISKVNLGIEKVSYEGTLDLVYESDIFKFIDYSLTDTDILDKLDDELGHIEMQDELRRAASTTHKGARTTIGQADGLVYQYSKKNNMTMINSKHATKEKFAGGFVKEPLGGRYDWVVDIDYTSQYPSIMNSDNIGYNTYIAKIVDIIDPGTQVNTMAFNYIYDKKSLQGKTIDIIFNPICNSKIEKISIEKLDKFCKENDAIITAMGTIFKSQDIEKSMFYPIIDTLFKQRKYNQKLKKEATDATKKKIFHCKQWSYKILLNSLYGVQANEHYRFYNIDLASTITGTGRELIKFAGHHIDRYMQDEKNIEIEPNFITAINDKRDYLLYCDTDSLFLWMGNYINKLKLEPTPELILKHVDILQDYVNTTLMEKYCQLHNIKIQYSMFSMKNELIASKYYTQNAKKHYALHIVMLDRKIVDIKKIVGLESVRSDVSEFTCNMLENIIYMILEDILDIDKIYKYIEEQKKIAHKLIDDRELSIFKTVAYSKDLSEYKNMPQHIKGMLMYNELEHDYFRSGHRGTLVNISGIDINHCPKNISENFNNKFLKKWSIKDMNCIVLPETITKVPDYYILDRKTIIENSVDDRCNLLLEPLIPKKEDSLLSW